MSRPKDCSPESKTMDGANRRPWPGSYLPSWSDRSYKTDRILPKFSETKPDIQFPSNSSQHNSDC